MNRGQQSSGKARNVQSFRDLLVWKKAHETALLVYQMTQTFPREELYGLTSQMRRAAVSTAANIVEGSKRHTRKDFAHFLNLAQGSNEEAKYYSLLAQDLGFLLSDASQRLFKLTDELGAMLHAFAVKLNSVAL